MNDEDYKRIYGMSADELLADILEQGTKNNPPEPPETYQDTRELATALYNARINKKLAKALDLKFALVPLPLGADERT